MTDVSDLISALVAIAKDPKTWEKRIDDMEKAAGNLAAARQLKKESADAADQAAKDLEAARYERGQAERATRDMGAQTAANAVRERDLRGAETDLARRRQAFEQEAANWKANVESREADLEAREKIAAKKLNDASKLMAAYDEAKHQAALKLAS
jgi:DNA repair exonuclease SbcCD ATPase subunit